MQSKVTSSAIKATVPALPYRSATQFEPIPFTFLHHKILSNDPLCTVLTSPSRPSKRSQFPPKFCVHFLPLSCGLHVFRICGNYAAEILLHTEPIQTSQILRVLCVQCGVERLVIRIIACSFVRSYQYLTSQPLCPIWKGCGVESQNQNL
jgi:hypothetical protein